MNNITLFGSNGIWYLSTLVCSTMQESPTMSNDKIQVILVVLILNTLCMKSVVPLAHATSCNLKLLIRDPHHNVPRHQATE